MNKSDLIQKLFDKGIFVTKEMIEEGLDEKLLAEIDDVNIVQDDKNVKILSLNHEIVIN